MRAPAEERESGVDAVAEPPRRNRGIIALGVALCIVAAALVAYLLGALDRIGLLP